MRVTYASLAIAAYLTLTSAQVCKQQPSGYDTTPGILAISSPDLTHPVTAGSNAIITWNVRRVLPSSTLLLQPSLTLPPPDTCQHSQHRLHSPLQRPLNQLRPNPLHRRLRPQQQHLHLVRP